MSENNSQSNIENIELSPYIERNFKRYAYDVIEDRAIPSVQDGLKPVQRRILYAMKELNLSSHAQTKKSAKVVGAVLGSFHPRGDTSVYEAMVNMAQDFSCRYPLVIGKGNFGSIDGDGAAAMRYTEAKLSPYGELMLQDIEKETIQMKPNYDESELEPVVLSGLFPNLLLNGSSGIAVAVATSLAPHRAIDIYTALDRILEDSLANKETDEDALIDIVKAPDFPTGGIIVNASEIKKVYKEGTGRVIIRSKYRIEESNKRESIIIEEIPFKVNKAKMVAQIDNLRKTTLSSAIKEIRDESTKDIRVVIELKKGTNANWVINNLLKHTDMQSTYPLNHVVLVNGKPKVNCSLKDLLEQFLIHSMNIVKNKHIFLRNKATERKDVVDGVLLALEHIDKVVEYLRSAESDEDAITLLSENIGLTTKQAKSIINMRMGTLTHASSDKYQEEQSKLNTLLDKYNAILKDTTSLLQETRTELQEIAKLFQNDSRRTEISQNDLSLTSNDKKDLIKDEAIVITFTDSGMIKSIREDEYKAQNRNTKGMKIANLNEDDTIRTVLNLSTKDDLLFFTNKGYCYTLPAYEIPISKRNSMGKYVRNLIKLDDNEKILAVLSTQESNKDKNVVIVTKKGLIKRLTPDTVKSRISRVKVITLTASDIIASVVFASEKDELVIFTTLGMGIRIKNDIRPSGRSSIGVRAIKLKESDYVVSMLIADNSKQYLSVSNTGIVKRTDFNKINVQGRAGTGIAYCKIYNNDKIVQVVTVDNNTDIFISTESGQIVRTASKNISVTGRVTVGVRGIRLDANDKVVSVCTTLSEALSEDTNNAETTAK